MCPDQKMDYPNYPPSFDSDLLANSFHAGNGEIGILPANVQEFLEACERDAIAILGWELWISDYYDLVETHPIPTPRKGSWAGIIPTKKETIPGVLSAVFSYDTKPTSPHESWQEYVHRTIEETQQQISTVNIEEEIQEQYVPFIRFNFALIDEKHH